MILVKNDFEGQKVRTQCFKWQLRRDTHGGIAPPSAHLACLPRRSKVMLAPRAISHHVFINTPLSSPILHT
jgi:hypothetical protein